MENASGLDVENYEYLVVEFNESTRRKHRVSSDAKNQRQVESRVLWFDRPINGKQVAGFNFINHDLDGLSEARSNSGSTSAWTTERIYIEDGVLQKEHNMERKERSDLDKDSLSKVRSQDHDTADCMDEYFHEGEPCYCRVDIIECDSWDWTCLVASVSAIAGAVKECAPCALDPTKICVAFCLLAGGGLAASAIDCSGKNSYYLRDECTIKKTWIPPSRFSREPSVDFPEDCQRTSRTKG